jgi:transcriptional regulator GlxA family with amidase domain
VFTGAGAYAITTASVGGRPVRTSSGLTITPDADLGDLAVPHTLVVPGGTGTRRPDPDLVTWVREVGSSAKRVASVCTGAFILAEAGLLDGRRATTHWAACGSFSRRYPEVLLDPEPIYVRDGPVYTSAGVTSGIDLALALVEDDLGRDTALTIARHLVMFLRRPGNQTQFSEQLSAQLAQREPIRDVQRWVADNPGQDLSVEALARRANLSARQFARAFTAEVGVTPGKYVGRVRLETARRLLEDSGDGVEEIARRCGYGTPESMRRAFLRGVGVGPAEYRRRF